MSKRKTSKHSKKRIRFSYGYVTLRELAPLQRGVNMRMSRMVHLLAARPMCHVVEA